MKQTLRPRRQESGGPQTAPELPSQWTQRGCVSRLGKKRKKEKEAGDNPRSPSRAGWALWDQDVARGQPRASAVVCQECRGHWRPCGVAPSPPTLCCSLTVAMGLPSLGFRGGTGWSRPTWLRNLA